MNDTRDISVLPPTPEPLPTSDEALRALRESEGRYRALFDNMGEGFALFGIVRGASGKIVDLIYREANKALERQTGFDRAKIIGQPLTAILPPSDAARFIPVLARAADPGEPTTIEEYAEVVDRWFEVSAYPHGQDEIVAIYRDISERKRAEAVLRESKERQAFLLKFSDALRAEPSAEAIADRAVRMLFEQMGLDRCFIGVFFLEEDRAEYHHQVHDDRLPPLPAEVRISDFPEAIQVLLDGSLVIDNVAEAEGFSDDERANIEALGMHALIDVPLRKGEKNPLWAIIAGSMHPRVWTSGEVALVEEVAERTWAAVERAQAEAALRESEARRELALEATEMGTFLWHVEEDRGEIDGRFRILFGQPPDGDLSLSDAMTLCHPDDAAGYAAAVVEATKPDGSRELRHDLRVKRPGGGWRWIAVTGKVSFDVTGRPLRMAGTLIDITARNTAEAVMRDSEERQAFLLKLSDALRAEPSAEAIANRALQMLFAQMRLDRCYVGIYRLADDIADFPHQVHDDRLPPVPAQIRLSDFPEALKLAFDRTMVIDDAVEMESFSDSDKASFSGLGLRAAIAATLRKGENNPLWAIVAGSIHPRVWTPGEVSLVEEVAERTWAAAERARAQAALRDSEERFHHFSDASTNILWIRDAATMRMELASPAFDTIYGFAGPDRGGDNRLRSWARLIVPEDRKHVLANFRRVRAGERVEQEFRIRRGSDGEVRWIKDVEFPLTDEHGRVHGVAGVGHDITPQKHAEEALLEREERLGVLVAELQHRTRNLIAIVRSTSDKTARASTDLTDFRARFRDRLDALARVQGLLSRLNDLDRVTFDDLINAEMTAMDSDPRQVTLEGPLGIRLRSSTVQTLAMALHELATNAVKYGALGQAGARLAVTWRWESSGDGGEPWLHIEWRETGVTMAPIGDALRGTGQGRELIERALPYQLSARTSYELGRDGVVCTISLPVSGTAVPEEAHA